MKAPAKKLVARAQIAAAALAPNRELDSDSSSAASDNFHSICFIRAVLAILTFVSSFM